MKCGFVTCVEFGLSCIESIYEIGGKLEIIITLKDNKYTKKSGRVYLDAFCKQHNVALLKIDSVNDSIVIEAIKENRLDWLFIIGWGWIASRDVLTAPLKGCIGWHPSKLPIGRGRASIPWAILKNLNETSVTLFKIDEGIDTGDIIKQQDIKIEPTETATTLSKKIMSANKLIIQNTWMELQNNRISLLKQDNSRATYWPGRTPEDGEIFSEMTKIDADRLIRATSKPFPGAFFMYQNKKVTVWSAKFVNKIEDETQICKKLKDTYLQPIDYEIN